MGIAWAGVCVCQCCLRCVVVGLFVLVLFVLLCRLSVCCVACGFTLVLRCLDVPRWPPAEITSTTHKRAADSVFMHNVGMQMHVGMFWRTSHVID